MTILAELEFADEAVSGTKRERDGLNAMLQAASEGRFGTLYFESLSRLARESVITMPMLKKLVYVDRVRVISVSEGIDSAQPNWDLQANFMAWVHEQYIKALRAAVLRGQEEAVLNDWSVGDWPFGYGSEPIPESEKSRRGRHPRPRMRVVINEEHADWVRRIFHWFTEEGKSLDWIARELTRQNAPKDHRSTTPGWHHDYVRRVLQNEKYIGIWPWGRNSNVRNPLTGQIMQEARPTEEAAKWVRERPHLRLVDDVTFFRAQARLDEFERKWQDARSDEGRLHGSKPNSQLARHLLQGLIKCAACGGTFQVSGAHGRYLGCSGYKRGLCQIKTRLARRLVEGRLLSFVTERVFAQPEWLEAVVEEARQSWEQSRRQEPSERDSLERKLIAVKSTIKRLVDAIEHSDLENEELRERLQIRSKEKQQLEYQILSRPVAVSPPTPPTREWVENRLRQLQELLQGGGTEANDALRQLVGGQILVEEATVPGRKRKHLIGKFRLSTRSLVANYAETPGPLTETETVNGEEVVVTFLEPPPWAIIAEEVKRLFDSGVEYERIAEELHCHRSWVAKGLAWWHGERGLPIPDGRQSRQRLHRSTKAEELADAAKALWDQGVPMHEMAMRLGCNRDTVTGAIRHWFESRNLPVLDGRNRRKALRLGPEPG